MPSPTTRSSKVSTYTTTNLQNVFSAHHSSISTTTIFETTKDAPGEANKTKNMIKFENGIIIEMLYDLYLSNIDWYKLNVYYIS